MIPDKRVAAAVLAVYAIAFAAGYALAAPDPGAWGAWRPLPAEGGEALDLHSCHPLPGGGVAAVLKAPLAGVVEWSWGEAYRLGFAPSASCVLGDGSVAVGGSVGGQPVIAIVSPGGAVEAYRVEGAWGGVVSLDCSGDRVAFAAATFNRELVVGVVERGGGGWAWLVGVEERQAWGAGAALTPGGAAAAAGRLIVEATPEGARAYRAHVEGANLTLEGAAWGPGGLAVYGSVESAPGGWGAGLVAWHGPGGWMALAFNTSSNAGRVQAALPLAAGFRLYYSPGSWWDADSYASPWGSAYGLRIVVPYPHIVKDPHFDGDTLTVPMVDVGEERRAVCLFLPRQLPSIIGPPGRELATVKPLSRPDWPRAHPLAFHAEEADARATALELAAVNVTVEPEAPGEWGFEHSGLDTPGYLLVGLAFALPAAAAAYYALGLDALPAPGGARVEKGEGRGG